MLSQFWRVLKPNGALLVFGQEPMASRLRLESRHYRYDWIWDKVIAGGFLNANRMPLRCHEVITVHYRRLPTYNPQFSEGKPYNKNREALSSNYRYKKPHITDNHGTRHPRDIIRIPRPVKIFGKDDPVIFHPTQKPVALIEYLVGTYTDEGQTVLDPFMGSGTTAVACRNTGRHYIGFELDKGYYEKSLLRIRGLG